MRNGWEEDKIEEESDPSKESMDARGWLTEWQSTGGRYYCPTSG
jgi:hypothetical protein